MREDKCCQRSNQFVTCKQTQKSSNEKQTKKNKTKPLREIWQQPEVDIRALRVKNLTFHHISSVCVFSPHFFWHIWKVNKNIVWLLRVRSTRLLKRRDGWHHCLTAEVSAKRKLLSNDDAAIETVGAGFEFERGREVNCRRRTRERRSKDIPKRNVCCDNYFLFWEIATSIGYLQNKTNKQKKKTMETSNETKRKNRWT